MYIVQGVSIQAISLKYVKAMRVPILVTKANSCPNTGTRVSQHRRGFHVLRHFFKKLKHAIVYLFMLYRHCAGRNKNSFYHNLQKETKKGSIKTQ